MKKLRSKYTILFMLTMLVFGVFSTVRSMALGKEVKEILLESKKIKAPKIGDTIPTTVDDLTTKDTRYRVEKDTHSKVTKYDVYWVEKKDTKWEKVVGSKFEANKSYRLRVHMEKIRITTAEDTFSVSNPTIKINDIELFVVKDNEITDSKYKKDSSIEADFTVYSNIFDLKQETKAHKITILGGTAHENKDDGSVVEVTEAIKDADIQIKANLANLNQEFEKWVVRNGNVDLYDSTDEFTGFVMPDTEVVIEAVYKDVTPKPEKEYNITVTGGKAFKINTKDVIKKAKKNTVITLIADKEPSGFKFDKWEVTKGQAQIINPNKKETECIILDKDVEIAATYTKVEVNPNPQPNNPQPNNPQPKEEFHIYFDLNGGTLHGQTDPIVLVAKQGDVIKLPEAPTRDGYRFTYWKGSKYMPGASYTVVDNHVFTAQWEKIVTMQDIKPENSKKDLMTQPKQNNMQIKENKKMNMKKAPKTGDSLMFVSYALILVLSGLVLIKKYVLEKSI